MGTDYISKISIKIGKTPPLIPRVERFSANGSVISKNFTNYIGQRVLKGLSNSRPGKAVNLMLYGHPSLGKTTELRNVTKLLSKNAKFKQNFLLMYSEFQRAETFVNQTMWENIRSGSILSSDAPKHETTLEEFSKTALEANKTPVIFLDTLDILLLDEVAGTSNTMDLWNEFLINTSKYGVSVFWTCRPYEWNYFKNKLNPKILKRTMDIELPPLDSKKCVEFPAILGSNKHRWSTWSLQLQSYMPLFANRWTVQGVETTQLSSEFFSQLSQHMEGIWDRPLGSQQLELPSTIYYQSLWSNICTDLETDKRFEKQEIIGLQNFFEKHIMAITSKSRSHRLRFSEENFTSDYIQFLGKSLKGMSSQFILSTTTNLKKTAPQLAKYRIQLTKAIDDLGDDLVVEKENPFVKELEEFIPLRDAFILEQAEIYEKSKKFLNVCKHHGLLNDFQNWFEFSHQLLFEETLFTQNSDELTSYQFPSVALRKLPPGSGKDLIRREAEKARVHWTGAALSFHPGISNAENADWNLWIEKAYQLGLIHIDEENEMNEKNTILHDYMSSNSDTALFLRGAPGTGKTYFCHNFIIEHLKTTTTKLLWRYVTLNKPLVDSVTAQWSEREARPQNSGVIGMQGHGSGARSVGEIIKAVLCESEDSTLHSITLLDFPKFKETLDHWFEKKGQGTIPPPSYTDAWSDLTSLFHHVGGARNMEILDEFDYEESPERSVTGTKTQRELFAKFCFRSFEENWKIYSNASYLARKQLMRARGKSRQKYDMLMLDEVQDITPSTMALLLLLLNPGFTTKSILIAGDDLQTVNRSGFAWKSFIADTIGILRRVGGSAHPELDRLTTFGAPYNIETELKTLKQVYRNAPKIATFNDTLRSTFADQYPTETMPNYPREFLKISDMAKEKNSDCQISIISAPSDHHVEKVINSLNTHSRVISISSKTSIITPYQSTLGTSLDSVGNFTTYNGETVKGLEFSGVVVFNPYELMYDEAEGNLNKGLQKSNIEDRIRKWMERDSNASMHSIEGFLRLYRNIMTRMNVLFSRPEYRLLIVTREPFPRTPIDSNAIRINRFFEAPLSIIFSLPTLPEDTISSLGINMLDMAEGHNNLDKFILDALRRESNIEGYSINDYLRWVMDESQISNFSNEKQSWENFLNVKPSELLKPQTTPIPVFSTLLLSGTSFAPTGSFISKADIKIPIVLTAFRNKYNNTHGWGTESEQSQSGVIEIFLTSLSKGIHQGELSIETYYSLGDLLEPFIEYVLRDAALCAEHYPYLLQLVGREILGIHFDEYSLNDGEVVVIDKNLAFGKNFKPIFTKPTLEDSISRMNGKNITLDSKAHILDKILIHISETIDHSVFDHILNPATGFNLAPESRNEIDMILNAPNESHFWVEMAREYPTWESVSDAPASIGELLASSIKRQELRHTVQMLWNLSSDNKTLTDWPAETNLLSLKKYFFEENKTSILSKFPLHLQSSTREFFEDVLDTQFIEFGGEDDEFPMRLLFKNVKFWSAIITDTLLRLNTAPPKHLSIEQKALWANWYFNVDGQRPPSSSAFFDYLSLIGQSFNSAISFKKSRNLAIELMLFMNFHDESIVENYPLMDDLLDVFEHGDILGRSTRAKMKTNSLMKALIAGPRLTVAATEGHVRRGEAKKIGERVRTSLRDSKYRVDDRHLEKRLFFLFQVVHNYTEPNENLKTIEPTQRGAYNQVYQSVIDFTSKIFTVLSGKNDDEIQRKSNYAEHFNNLVTNLESPNNVLSTRKPFVGENNEEAWSQWLAILLYGALEYQYSIGGKSTALEIGAGKRVIAKTGGRIITNTLHDYFAENLANSSADKFFKSYFSMVNCGFYVPPASMTFPEGDVRLRGVLTGIESHFNISKRTGFFIGALTELIDRVLPDDEQFKNARETTPMRYHPAYDSALRIGGVSPSDIRVIRNSNAKSSELAVQFGLDVDLVSEIRSSINFVPFYYKSKSLIRQEDGTEIVRQLTNQKFSIQQPRMSAFDIAYPPINRGGLIRGNDPRKEGIVKNLDGLSKAIGGSSGSHRKRIIHHICYAMANSFDKPSSQKRPADMKVSIGRYLAIEILRSDDIERTTRLEDYQLDWRVLYEMMRMNIQTNNTFDMFVDFEVQKITESESTELTFNSLLEGNEQLAEFFELMINPIQYLFTKNQVFNIQSDFTTLPRTIDRTQLFFLRQNSKSMTQGQKIYANNIAWGFIRYTMYRAGFDCAEDIDESVPIDQRIFNRRD